ncbi:hypothetical protein [Rhodococcus sp. BP22]|uniref:hypothetical protein n=1 Tax=Rhodococcus sp. BP22 TaxID=2758566 RepID=UPI001645D0A5|nr:hypothetical protein [Rhodococcus sp. BP22]
MSLILFGHCEQCCPDLGSGPGQVDGQVAVAVPLDGGGLVEVSPDGRIQQHLFRDGTMRVDLVLVLLKRVGLPMSDSRDLNRTARLMTQEC